MVLNGIRNIFGILFPLITFPYASRVLGVDAIGKFNFSNSLVGYIILLANLGINAYVIREGSRLRDDKEKLEEFISQTFTINMLTTLLSYIVLFALLLIPKFNAYIVVILILSIQVIFKTFGVEWIYSIYEDYLYITIRSLISQILFIAFLFTFVHSPQDLVIYTIITVFVNSSLNLINYFYARKYCNIKLTAKLNLKQHLEPILILFASQVAVTIYVSSDVTILGLFNGDYDVGIYSIAVKIYTLIKMFLAAVIVVGIPRLSNLLGSNKKQEFNTVANDIYKTILTLAIPSVFGIIMLRNEIVLLIAGSEYIQSVSAVFLLSFAIICYLGAYFWGQCILVPNRNEKVVLNITIASAIANILLNLFLIPKYGVNAAAITTIFSEGLAFILCRKYGKKYMVIDNLNLHLLKVTIGCVPMFIFYYIFKLHINSMLLYTCLTVILSVVSYSLIEYFIGNESLAFVKKFLKKYNLVSWR